jgi:hypothetical protein
LRINAAEKPGVMMEVVVCVEDHRAVKSDL